MKKLVLYLFIICTLGAIAQERTRNFPKYTLTEFYQMVEAEKSDTFTLKNANIIYDTIADSEYLLKKLSLQELVSTRKDSIEINKALVLENVFMPGVGADDNFAVALNKVIFRKPVSIKNSEIWFYDNHFLSEMSLTYDDTYYEGAKENFENEREYSLILFHRCVFEDDPMIRIQTVEEEKLPLTVWFDSSVFKGVEEPDVINWWVLSSANFVHLENNTFINDRYVTIRFSGNRGRILNNDFGKRLIEFRIGDEGAVGLSFRENKINQKLLLRLPENIQNLQMDWDQFTSGVVGSTNYTDFVVNASEVNSISDLKNGITSAENLQKYTDSARIVNNIYYKSEIGLLGTLNAIYKRQHDMESANASFIALKDLETQRLEYLYDQDPSFATYFEWQVNRFLKAFSDYGTRPAKAIVVSLYVILFFALIYLFFPNSWDKHGRRRIMDRYRFFTKYMHKDAGIHEVYLEDQQPELLDSEDFKNYMQKAGKSIPKFFLATAMPLYKWSVSGTKLWASVLRRVDIMQGSWEELPKSKRIWKSILLIGAFGVAILYDLIIKILNALMLSINTFTTLGFGEIPIKGLPRYLAIVQGFIGWFMLTIFSVSLISQLLN